MVFELCTLIRLQSRTANEKAQLNSTLGLIYSIIDGLVTADQNDLAQILANSNTEFTWLASFSINFISELSLRLSLEAMQAADYCGSQEMAYEFAVQVNGMLNKGSDPL